MTEYRTYPCVAIKKKQWKFQMVTFFVDASDLKQWCGVYRKSISKEGYQRTVKADHWESIRKFLMSDTSANVIPNSIVIAFNDRLTINNETEHGASVIAQKTLHPIDPLQGVNDDETVLTMGELRVRIHPQCLAPENDETDEKEVEEKLSDIRSAYVIDGQHRIWGGNAASTAVYYPITGFIGIDKEEQAFHFIVINGKAKKVSKHDIDAVIPEEIYKNLQKRLNSAGIYSTIADVVWALDNDADSPFAGKIKWANNNDPKAPFSKGGIDKLLKCAEDIPLDIVELFENKVILIKCLWRGVKKALGNLWDGGIVELAPGETYSNELIGKSAAVLPAIQIALNRWMSNGGVQASEALSEGELEKKVYEYFSKLPHEFFYCVWKQKSITNDHHIEELAGLVSTSIRTSSVPYGAKFKDWFEKPQSHESRKAQRELQKKQKKMSNPKKRTAKKKN
jgi:DGQHR domain-containing protein